MKSNLFAHCSAAVCVAEDSSIGFYAPKTLKKFRVESFSDSRVVGLAIVAESQEAAALHILDAAGVYTIVSISNFGVKSTNKICIPSSDGLSKPHPRGGRRAPTPVSGETSSSGTAIAEAHFYTAPTNTPDGRVFQGSLRCVVVLQGSVVDVDPSANDASNAVQIPCAVPATTPLVAVGSHSGIVAVSAVGANTISLINFSGKRTVVRRALGKLVVASLAVSGVESAVAVGGSRGELAVFPAIDSSNCFSDHWHHTRLTALAFSPDARALFSGAGESVLLQWSMRDFSFRKIGCSLGPIKAIIASASHPSNILLPCADSSLAIVDTLQQRVVASCEGVAWSSGECTGIVAASWMGQPAVVLTGMPECVKICDPLTRQALYSLHITHQMETVANLPRCGITSVAILDEGRTIVSYEQFEDRALPSSMRFWTRAASSQHHIELQKIHTPHDDPILSLLPDVKGERLFSLSSSMLKCWHKSSPAAAASTDSKLWSCLSFTPTPSRHASSMVLSSDGTALFVADDVVHVFGVSSVLPGVRWNCLMVLSQSISSVPLRSLVLLESAQTIGAIGDQSCVFLWSLQSMASTRVSLPAPPTSMCELSDGTFLVGLATGEVVELSTTGTILSKRSAHGVPRFLCRVSVGNSCVAMLDSSNSLRVLSIAPQAAAVVVGLPKAAEAAPSQTVPALTTYFKALEVANGEEADEEAGLRSAESAQKSKKWLEQVLGGESYSAPSMSMVLSSYLAATN